MIYKSIMHKLLYIFSLILKQLCYNLIFGLCKLYNVLFIVYTWVGLFAQRVHENKITISNIRRKEKFYKVLQLVAVALCSVLLEFKTLNKQDFLLKVFSYLINTIFSF